LDGVSLNKIGAKHNTLVIETSNDFVKFRVDTGNMQEKLTAISDATNSKALARITVRSIGGDNTMTVTQANSVSHLAVDETNIQEKPIPGTILADDNSGSILSSTTKVRGLKGQRCITVSGDNEKLLLTGPPSADWTGLTGPVGDIHFIDTGVNRLQIRDDSDPRQPIAEFNPQTRYMWTYGSVVIDKGLTAKSVEVVKSETDPSSGLLQTLTIKIKEITPIAPETNVKIVNLISNNITPSIGAA
jgi:hypothetical protein